MDEEMIVVEQDLNSLPPEAIKRREKRTVLDLDLNSLPPDENSIQSNTPELSVPGSGISQGQTANVVEIHDNDDVQVTFREIFAVAGENSRRNLELDLQSIEDWLRHSEAGEEFLRSVPPEHSRGLDLTLSIANTADTPGTSQTLSPRSDESNFICRLCFDQFVNETATKCGHIFCERCIKIALGAKKKCPICRKPTNLQDTFRIYFPWRS